MVAAGQAMDVSFRHCSLVEVEVRRWYVLIVQPVKEMDRHAARKARAESLGELEIIHGPTAFADERGGDEEDPIEPRSRGSFRERFEENRRADGVSDQDGRRSQFFEHCFEGLPPRGILRILFARHSRIEDFIFLPKVPSQAVDELVVPFVMRALAAALNEHQLTSELHRIPPVAREELNVPLSSRSGHDGVSKRDRLTVMPERSTRARLPPSFAR